MYSVPYNLSVMILDGCVRYFEGCDTIDPSIGSSRTKAAIGFLRAAMCDVRHITLKPVTSSNIEAAGYCVDHGVLAVVFNGGGMYVYFCVPREKYDEMVSAESVGKYLNTEIKPSYLYECVKDEL